MSGVAIEFSAKLQAENALEDAANLFLAVDAIGRGLRYDGSYEGDPAALRTVAEAGVHRVWEAQKAIFGPDYPTGYAAKKSKEGGS